jgi:outer membrane receptor protein involved in Fe transport
MRFLNFKKGFLQTLPCLQQDQIKARTLLAGVIGSSDGSVTSIKESLIQKGIASMKISMRIVTLALLALCMALFTSGAMAQTTTTGTIEGNVVDTNGNPVPGVTVTVTSPNLISPQSATTNDEGRYRILNLPPGRYNVSVASSQGFAEFKQENVEVNLSRSTSVAVTLQPAGTTAVVNVTDTSGANVDVTTNTTGTNVSTEQFSNFPTQRTVQSLYNIAPTATQSGLRDAAGRPRDPSVAGASGPENNYILDGVTTSDPAYGGGGANLPFEFVQEIEIKTGAFGAEYGKATGGIFNVITKSGGNEFTGDIFAYYTAKSFVRRTENFSFSTASNNGFSEVDAGVDIGGPIVKNKLWFFGAFNPQYRRNYYLGQSTRVPFDNKVSTPFYAGKITWAVNQNNTATFSTFGDFTTIEGFQINQTGSTGGSSNGFGVDPRSFLGTTKSGGHNYAARLNSVITPNWIGEFSVGLHYQRYNRTPTEGFESQPATFDNFSILTANQQVAPIVQTGLFFGGGTGFVDYSYSPGGSLQRTVFRNGYAPIFMGKEDRNRWEVAARLQNLWGRHTFKYGFEMTRNIYDINNVSTGPTITFNNTLNNLPVGSGASTTVSGFRVDHRFLLCTVRGTQIVCPSQAAADRAALLVGQTIPGGTTITAATVGTLTLAEVTNNPFLIRNQTRIRDFRIIANTKTNVESFYFQDDFKITKDVQLNAGVRWDYQQAYGNPGEGVPLRFNSFIDNLQPRIGLIWDFTGQGRGKLFINYARFVETPIPLDINVRALSDTAQTDNNIRLDRYGFPANLAAARIVTGLSGATTPGGAAVPIAAQNLGHDHTPPDPDLKPQTVNEATAGFEYEVVSNLAIGVRGVYRAQGSVIEDGSFDDGDSYFLFNPGESLTDRLAREQFGAGFGRARRYYRAIELTATKRFSNNYQFIASYVFSSLTGNYEGLFRNDNGQADPNITSLFDLVSLLGNTYGRLPNDRPHQLKFDGSYQTPWKFMVSGSFRGQSGTPFNALVPHPVYGNNEGFGVPRGTALFPADAPGGIRANTNRGPFTWQLDLGGYYPINVGENKQLRFTVDWFNVFNNQRALIYDTTFSLGTGLAGVPDVPNPFYGTGTVFQFPSTLRLGAKFSF